MAENQGRPIGDDEARMILAQGERRARLLERVRGGNRMNHVIGVLLGTAVMYLPVVLHLQQDVTFIVAGIVVMVAWEHRETGQRLEALVDILERDGVIKR